MPKEVIVFSSQSCAPCKQIKPELEKQAAGRGFALRVIDMKPENKEEFAKYEVRGVPTVVCHDGDQEVGRFIGTQTAASISDQLDAWGL